VKAIAMKPLLLTTAAAAAILSLAACGDRRDEAAAPAALPDVAETTPSTGALTAEGAPFRFAGENSPEGFAQRVAMSDMYEIEASRLALERAQSPQVRSFAQTMIDAHTATTNELKTTMQGQNLAPPMPTALDPDHRRRVNDLRAAAAGDFDKLYLDQQTAAHASALDELEDFAGGGTNPALKTWAAKTAPTVRQHLERAKTLDRGGADGTETPTADVTPNR